jgi:hypothetical protein
MAWEDDGPWTGGRSNSQNYSKPKGPKGGKPETIELHHVQIGREHEGIKLTKYGDKISLNPYFDGSDGRRYMRFCYPKTKTGASENHYPMGVDLGNGFGEAIKILKQFILVLEKEMDNAGQNREGKGR